MHIQNLGFLKYIGLDQQLGGKLLTGVFFSLIINWGVDLLTNIMIQTN